MLLMVCFDIVILVWKFFVACVTLLVSIMKSTLCGSK